MANINVSSVETVMRRIKEKQSEQAYMLTIENVFKICTEKDYDITQMDKLLTHLERTIKKTETNEKCLHRRFIFTLWKRLLHYIPSVLRYCVENSVSILPLENESWILIAHVIYYMAQKIPRHCHKLESHRKQDFNNLMLVALLTHTITRNTELIWKNKFHKEPILRCKNCKLALYSTKEQQEKDFTYHKKVCTIHESKAMNENWRKKLQNCLIAYNHIKPIDNF